VSDVERLLANNEKYAATKSHLAEPRPDLHVAIVTCMDARIDVFAALGLQPGEAVVIRNAGARVTEDVLRSLALAVHALHVDTVVLMQHTRCRLSGVSDDELKTLTGAELDFLPIDDHAAALASDIEHLQAQEVFAPVKAVAGVLYDVDTARITRLR
jgi:carbonic anhydrase